jgi:ribose/xylose/arabinose/galactoside ABC-type transport system permease subunit
MYAQPAPLAGRPRSAWVGLIAHLGWEAILLLVTVTVAVVLFTTTPLGLDNAEVLFSNVARLGFVAAGLALSLRTATPNLAVGALAGFAGLVYAKLLEGDWPVPAVVAVALLSVAAIGAVMGVLTGLTSAPAWAVSLGGVAAVQAVQYLVSEGNSVFLRRGTMGVAGAVWWALIFVLVSLAGGALWQVRPIRDLFGAARAPGDPVAWRPARLLGALVGMTGSALLAGAGGVITAALLSSVQPFESGQLVWALGAVLLGGVSAFGKRGGVAGTVLGVAVLSLVTAWFVLKGWSAGLNMVIPAVAILVGLVVGRILEGLAGPEPVAPATRSRPPAPPFAPAPSPLAPAPLGGPASPAAPAPLGAQAPPPAGAPPDQSDSPPGRSIGG